MRISRRPEDVKFRTYE